MILKIAKISALCVAFLLAAGASAYLTLTFIIKSEDTVIVPNLVGKDVVSALELLTDLQLNTKVSGSEYSQQFPKNHVVFQEPDAGSEIKKDRDVRIIISKGPQNILMPNLISLTQQQARMIIDENGLAGGQLSHTYSSLAQEDRVIDQAPAAGKMITRRTRIDLLLSLGPHPVAYLMPDLTGLSLDQAAFLIEKNNLRVGDIRSDFDAKKARDSILRQDPPAGYQVIESSPVNLVINRLSGGNRLHRPLYGTLLQYHIKNGFLKKHIRVELENMNETTELLDEFMKPGENIWVLVPRDRNATVYIFEDDELVDARIYEAW
jgi:serine/threonine-protein kinase